MIRILYIGNKLSNHGYTQTSIETLGELLESENLLLFYASSKKSKFIRMLEMVYKTIFYSNKVDYVLIDTYSTKNFWYAFFISQLCRLLKLKYIPKLHGGNLPIRIEKNKYLSDLLFNNAYVNIAPSKYLFDIFKNHGYKNILFIPNTITLTNYSFEDKKIDFPKIIWVRSFSRIYNPLMAVKVFIKIKKIYPEAQLCMVGPVKDDSYTKTIRLAEKNKVNIELTGLLTKTELVKKAANFNIFINTTHFDNTPISVIEAMAQGLPVVSTNVGGIPYLLQDKHDALLVKDNDVNGMVDCIKEIIDNDPLRAFIVNNAKDKVNQFDWEIVKSKWLEILK